MSKIVSTVSTAVQNFVSGNAGGVKNIEQFKEARPFEVTLSQRAPATDNSTVHRGSCLCGAVHIEVDRGTLANFQGFCHCESCRRWHSAPIAGEILFKAENGTSKIYLVKGAENLKLIESSKGMRRACCSECGSRMVNLSSIKMVAATFPSVLQDWPFNPACHLFYKEHESNFGADNLPKYKNAPTEMGGDGELAQ